MNPHYPNVSQRAGHRCEYCHAPEAIFNFPFEVEHIVPISQGGTDDEAGLALACRSCNLSKSDHVTGFDEASQSEERIFHPREDIWVEHFSVDKETGVIVGLTSVGRATVNLLRLNRAEQLAARIQWIRLGLFP